MGDGVTKNTCRSEWTENFSNIYTTYDIQSYIYILGTTEYTDLI